jgi:hypothetical protein
MATVGAAMAYASSVRVSRASAMRCAAAWMCWSIACSAAGRSPDAMTSSSSWWVSAELPRHLHQQRVVGEPPEVLVELLVELVHQRQVVLLAGADHRVHDRLELGPGGRGEPAPQLPYGELLEHHPQARHLLEHPRRQAGHPRAAPGRPHHQALLLQPGQRLAQRDVADAEQRREAALDEAVAGGVDAALDVRPEPVRDGVGEAVIGQRLGHAGPPG